MSTYLEKGPADLSPSADSNQPELYQHISGIEHPKAYAAITPPMILASFRALKELGLIGAIIPNSQHNSFLSAATDLLIAHGLMTAQDASDGVFYMLTPKGEDYIRDYDAINTVHETYTDIMATVEEVAGLEKEVEAQPFSLKVYLSWNGPIEQRQLDAWFVPALSLLELIKTSDGATAASILATGDTLNIDNLRLRSEETKQEFIAFLKVLEVAGLLILDADGNASPSADAGKRRVFRLAGYALLALSYYQVMQELDKLISGEKEYGLNKDLYRQAEMNAHASNADMALAVGPALTRILNGKDQFDGFEGELNPETVIDYGSGGGEVLMRFVEGVPSIQKAYGIDFNKLTVAAAQKIAEERGFADDIHYHYGSITEEDALRAVREQIEADGLKPGMANINAIAHDIGHAAFREHLGLHAKVFGNTPLIVTEAMRIPLEAKAARPDYRPVSFDFMHGISLQELFSRSELLAAIQECGYKVLGTKTYSSMPDARGEERLPVGVSFLVQYQGS